MESDQATKPASRCTKTIAVFLAVFAVLAILCARFDNPVGSDGVYYFSYLPSLVFDIDLDLANQYTALEDPYELGPSESHGLRNPFQIGTALFWLPFYLIGHLIAFLTGNDSGGLGNIYRWAVAMGSVFYGTATILLLLSLLREWVSDRVAGLSVFGIVGGSFFFYYLTVEPSMSHAVSAFAVTLFVRTWWKHHDSTSLRAALLVGLLLGLAGSVRAQNLLFAAIPLVYTLLGFRKGVSIRPPALALGIAGVLLGFSPHLIAVSLVHGKFVLIPQGSGFMRWTSPLLEPILFSMRSGLFAVTPILYLAVLGLLLFVRKRSRLGLSLLAGFVVQWYLNACVDDWYAGASFGMRRFSGSLVLFSVGLAAILEELRRFLDRHPRFLQRGVLFFGVLVFVWLNLEAVRVYRSGESPAVPESLSRDRALTIAESRIRGLYGRIGNPAAIPANWLFAWRYRVSPLDYDSIVGWYFTYDYPFPGQELNAGRAEYERYIREGFYPLEPDAGQPSLRMTREETCRFLVPLKEKRELDVEFEVSPAFCIGSDPVSMTADWNGKRFDPISLVPGRQEHAVRLATEEVRIGINELRFHIRGKIDLPCSIRVTQGYPEGKTAGTVSSVSIGYGTGEEILKAEGSGILLVGLDSRTGRVLRSDHFETHNGPWEHYRAARFIRESGPEDLFVGVIGEEGSKNWAYTGQEALWELGVSVDLRGKLGRRYAFIGKRGAPRGTAIETLAANGWIHLDVRPGEVLPIAIQSIEFKPVLEGFEQ